MMKKMVSLAAAVLVAYAAGAVKVTDVSAKQRYPWNGKVDINFTVSGAGSESRSLVVRAWDRVAGTTNVAVSVTGETSYSDGSHHVVWDMQSDGLTMASTNVLFGISYIATPTYCVIDISGGTSSSSYPVSFLDNVPDCGWTDEYKTTKLVMRRIAAGTFTMGSPDDEVGRSSDETEHSVTLTDDYWMGVFQITQRQWELVMGTRPSCFNNSSYYKTRPVEKVSYNMIRGSSEGANWPETSDVDSSSFLGVLRNKADCTVDLPTEAQWEYACRAETTTALNSGEDLSSKSSDSAMNDVGRYEYNSGYYPGLTYKQNWSTSSGTAVVGSYGANDWGLYDMHGNVREWCLDRYGEYADDEIDPVGATSGTNRVLRGGSWINNAANCRSASRHGRSPSSALNSFGFRLCCTEEFADETTPVWSGMTRADLTEGTRTAARTEAIEYSTGWDGTTFPNATAMVAVDGETLSEESGSGTVSWVPTTSGTHTLTHQVMTNGVAAGEQLTATFTVDGPVTPVISPASGQTFSDSLAVAITCATTDGVTIHYTTNGTLPTVESPTYKRFRIYGKTTVKAIAIDANGISSEIAEATYAYGTCGDPEILPKDGTVFYNQEQLVTISGGTYGVIHYTLDGSEPTVESATYTEPFAVSNPTNTIKAKSFNDNYFDSQTVTATLTRNLEIVPTPTIDAPNSFSGSGVAATCACAKDGVVMHYTLDGSDPTEDSTIYDEQLWITNSCTIKVRGFLADEEMKSQTATLAISKVWTFGDALNMPDQTFTSSGSASWVCETNVTHDGVHSLRSGKITDSQTSTFSTTFTGKGTLTFWWKADCEGSDNRYDCDHGEFVCEGVTNCIDGVAGWQKVTRILTGNGQHAVSWSYVKDDAGSDDSDCIWVDEVTWTPYALPELGDDATPQQVASALSDAKDAKLTTHVNDAAKYREFRDWADGLSSEGISHADVMESSNAYLSFALDTDVLIDRAPTNGEMRVVSVTPQTSESGCEIDLVVAIDNVFVGSSATEENLSTVFTVEGSPEVNGVYSSANVTCGFGTPQDGKVIVTATPNDGEAPSFFMRVRMEP